MGNLEDELIDLAFEAITRDPNAPTLVGGPGDGAPATPVHVGMCLRDETHATVSRYDQHGRHIETRCLMCEGITITDTEEGDDGC